MLGRVDLSTKKSVRVNGKHRDKEVKFCTLGIQRHVYDIDSLRQGYRV